MLRAQSKGMAEGAKPPILVGVDFSENGKKAFQAAIRLAQDMGTSLVIVHVFPEMKAPSLISGQLEKEIIAEAKAEVSKEEAMTLAEEWVVKARDEGLDVEVVATDGVPHEVVIQAAKDHGAGLIVVGTHGRTGLKRVLMGSVAENVVRNSSIPVVIVPRGAKK